MISFKKEFHYLSYLQYPFMLVAIFYIFRPILNDLKGLLPDFNTGLVYLGLGISLSTLQDTAKTQNKISKRIFQNPRYAKRFLIVLAIEILVFIGLGLFGFYQNQSNPFKELSYGFLSIGIGMIGMLKSASEMAEHQSGQTSPSVQAEPSLRDPAPLP